MQLHFESVLKGFKEGKKQNVFTKRLHSACCTEIKQKTQMGSLHENLPDRFEIQRKIVVFCEKEKGRRSRGMSALRRKQYGGMASLFFFIALLFLEEATRVLPHTETRNT